MARKTKTGNEQQIDSDVEGNVDKIRDILFGGHMRDYDQRFDALEKSLNQSIERLGRDLEKRIDRLDNYARREIDKLTDQVKAEKKDRIADIKSGASDVKELTDQVEVWFGDVDEQLATETKDLRESIHEQHESLSQLIRETREQLDDSLTSQSRSLAESKLAKEDLAGLLSEVALRLQNDFKLPKG